LFLFKLEFSSQLSEVRAAIALCLKAGHAIRHSSHLKRVLEIILALGNALNRGTSKGDALGFHIRTITKLSSTKSTTSKTLLDFLVTTVVTSSPESKQFVNDLCDLAAAVRVDLAQVSTDLGKTVENAHKLGDQLRKEFSANDKFVSVMTNVHRTASQLTHEVQLEFKALEEQNRALLIHFNDPSMKMEELFQIFLEFTRQFVTSEQRYHSKQPEDVRSKQDIRKKKEKLGPDIKSRAHGKEAQITHALSDVTEFKGLLMARRLQAQRETQDR